MTAGTKKQRESENRVEALRASRIHAIKPKWEEIVEIPIEMVDSDPTNPGGDKSVRYQRREDSMLDSFDILGRVIYPIIVCEHPENAGRYLQVDGYGRLNLLRAKGAKTVRAIVYPKMSLEERILLRETLNAAQEPFDAASIINDLKLLARERGLNLNDTTHLKTLVRDLPARVQSREKDLVLLTQWHPEVIEQIGEHYTGDQEIIGLDQLRGLTRLLNALAERHPKVVKESGGKSETSLLLAKAFYAKKFAQGMRSQEGIRQAIKAAKSLPENSVHISRFLRGDADVRELSEVVDTVQEATRPSQEVSIITACQHLTSLLIEVDASTLSEGDLRALKRTQQVLESVVSS